MNVAMTGWLALLLCAAGCAGPLAGLRRRASATTPVGQFHVHYADPDRPSAERVASALENAAPRLLRWGTLDEPVTVHVLPDHASLEEAVSRRDYPWLRAWGKYDEIFVQSPRTWGLLGASQEAVDELVLHELTHCLMYQLASDRLGWSRKEIPLWFREGMASFTAEQAYRWPTLEALARTLERRPDLDLLGASESLYRGRSNLVYGAAHHAFTFLVDRYGEESVRRVLSAMERGATFPSAFEIAVGLPPATFLRDFSHYLRWRGFQGGAPKRRGARP